MIKYVTWALIGCLLFAAVAFGAASYSIEVLAPPSLEVSPLDPVDSGISTLNYSVTDSAVKVKIEVKAEGIPQWLSYLKLYTGTVLDCGTTTHTNEGAALLLSSTLQSFITGIDNCTQGAGVTLNYVVSMESTDWATPAGTEAEIVVSYIMVEDS